MNFVNSRNYQTKYSQKLLLLINKYDIYIENCFLMEGNMFQIGDNLKEKIIAGILPIEKTQFAATNIRSNYQCGDGAGCFNSAKMGCSGCGSACHFTCGTNSSSGCPSP